MKALKRFLVLALALIMSLSLFACGNNGEENNGDDNKPSGDENTVSELKAPDILEYVFDNQVLKNNTFSLEYKDEPTEVIFAETSDVEYPVVATENDGKMDVEMESVMLSKNMLFQFADDKGLKFADITVTVNPITNNYYNVDKDASGAGYTIKTVSKATGVKFNGAENVTGVTVGDNGINFAKTLFTGETMGHNTVEYVDNGVKYVVSVCAVTQKELESPITFEDGKISPFIGTFSAKSQPEVVDVFEDCANADASQMRYYIKKDGTEIENRKQLAVESDTLLFIATEYLVARADKLQQREGWVAWSEDMPYHLTAKIFNGTSDKHLYGWFESDVIVEGTTGKHPSHTAYFGRWYNNGANFSEIFSYDMYKDAVNGSSKYIKTQIVRLEDGTLTRMYIDDIGANLDLDHNGVDVDMWHGGNSSIHNQYPAGVVDGTQAYNDFRILMDKVCLED